MYELPSLPANNMLTFRASAGYRASQLLSARLSLTAVSVHKEYFYAINNAGDLLLFQSEDIGITPLSVVIQDYAGMLETLNVQRDIRIDIRRDGTVTAENGRALRLRWSCAPYDSPILTPINRSVLLAGSESIERFLIEREQCEKRLGHVFLLNTFREARRGASGHKEPFGAALESGFLKLFNALESAAESDTEYAVKEAVSGVIGIGLGMTPSSDDILSGMIYCLLSFADQGFSCPQISILRQSILDSAGGTTLISSAYLIAAAMKWPSPLLDDVLRGIFVPGHDLNSAMVRLNTVGSSSGGEMLLGIALGILLLIRHGYIPDS